MTPSQEWADLKQFRFGDSPELAGRLAALVVAGVKTATCSAVANGFEAALGEQQIVLSGEGRPVAVIRVGPSGVEVKPVIDFTKIGVTVLLGAAGVWSALRRR